MGIADLKAAFNDAAGGELSCNQATLNYEHAHDITWQRLAFRGIDVGGKPFELRS